jgi:hypothetical protein
MANVGAAGTLIAVLLAGIDADVTGKIATNWLQRKPTWQGSSLGGGIGFHGWITTGISQDLVSSPGAAS